MYHDAYRIEKSLRVPCPTQQQWLRLDVVCSFLCSEAATNDEKLVCESLARSPSPFFTYPQMSSVSSPL